MVFGINFRRYDLSIFPYALPYPPIPYRTASIYFLRYHRTVPIYSLPYRTHLFPTIPYPFFPLIQVDLLVLLDTSASIYHAFQRQRQLALDLLARVSVRAAPDALRAGVIQFAHEPRVVHSLRDAVKRAELLDAVRAIEFTGRWGEQKWKIKRRINTKK